MLYSAAAGIVTFRPASPTVRALPSAGSTLAAIVLFALVPVIVIPLPAVRSFTTSPLAVEIAVST